MSEREELVQYLERVRTEVTRRKERVQAIDSEIAEMELSIRKQHGGSLDVQMLKLFESKKAQAAETVAKKRKEREGALQDLHSAEQREADVLQELSELEG